MRLLPNLSGAVGMYVSASSFLAACYKFKFLRLFNTAVCCCLTGQFPGRNHPLHYLLEAAAVEEPALDAQMMEYWTAPARVKPLASSVQQTGPIPDRC